MFSSTKYLMTNNEYYIHEINIDRWVVKKKKNKFVFDGRSDFCFFKMLRIRNAQLNNVVPV